VELPPSSRGWRGTRLTGLRRRLGAVADALEHRVVARPFRDEAGEKGLWAWLSHSPPLRVAHCGMTIEGWPRTGRPLRIAFLSDLHTGSHPDDVTRLATILDEAARHAPDLACLGGDYVNGMLFGRGRVPPRIIASVLARMRPPLGTFAILGDHDERYGPDRVAGPLREAGLTVLVNETAAIRFEDVAIQIVGVLPDGEALPALVSTLPRGAPAIVLAHDPAAFAQLPRGPYPMLCGHTHGGQIQLPWVGPLVNMSDAPLRWTYGHVVEGGRQLYVTSGLGMSGLPLRLGIPPEIAIVEVSAPP